MSDSQTPAYTALKPLRFGNGVIQPGQPVPFERGRDYALMLRRGDIVATPATQKAQESQQVAQLQQAPAPADNPVGAALAALALPVGLVAWLISDDGLHTAVTVEGYSDSPAGNEALGVKAGGVVASVIAEGEGKPFDCNAASLLPAHPTYKLIRRFNEDLDADFSETAGAFGFAVDDKAYALTSTGVKRVTVLQHEALTSDAELDGVEYLAGDRVAIVVDEEGIKSMVGLNTLLPVDALDLYVLLTAKPETEAEGDEGKGEDQSATEELLAEVEAERARLAILLSAVTAAGEPLADDTPSRKTLLANHITTVEGLVILASGENGAAYVSALKNISDKQAANVVEYLKGKGLLPEAEAQPEAPQDS